MHEMCFPGNTKHLYNICTMLDQRRRRWAGVVQLLYKCFVFVGITWISRRKIFATKCSFIHLLTRPPNSNAKADTAIIVDTSAYVWSDIYYIYLIV